MCGIYGRPYFETVQQLTVVDFHCRETVKKYFFSVETKSSKNSVDSFYGSFLFDRTGNILLILVLNHFSKNFTGFLHYYCFEF